MNQNIVEYFRLVREDETLQAAYSGRETMDQFYDIVVEEGEKLGLHYTRDDLAAIGISPDAIMDLHNAAANDDELNDFELDMVSAGIPIQTGKEEVHA